MSFHTFQVKQGCRISVGPVTKSMFSGQDERVIDVVEASSGSRSAVRFMGRAEDLVQDPAEQMIQATKACLAADLLDWRQAHGILLAIGMSVHEADEELTPAGSVAAE